MIRSEGSMKQRLKVVSINSTTFNTLMSDRNLRKLLKMPAANQRRRLCYFYVLNLITCMCKAADY